MANYLITARPANKAALSVLNPPPKMALLSALTIMFHEHYEDAEVQRYLEARQTGQWIISRHSDVSLLARDFQDTAKTGPKSEAHTAVACARLRKVRDALATVLTRSHCLPPRIQGPSNG